MPGQLTTLPTGREVNLSGGFIEERAGLGEIPTRWPDLRIWVEGDNKTLEPDSSRAIVPFKIPWDRHYLLCAELIGWPYVDASGQFKRHLPESYRNWEWKLVPANPLDAPRPVMYCTKIVSVGGMGGNTDQGHGGQKAGRTGNQYYPDPTYEFAKVVAQFETLTYDIKLRSQLVETSSRPYEMQRNVFRQEKSGGRFLTHDWGQWELRNGSEKREANTRQVNYWESFNTVTYTWYDVLPEWLTDTHWDRCQLMQGKSNSGIFDRFAPETLMLQHVDRMPRMTPLGIRTYQVTFDFLHVPTNVNKARPPGPTATPEYWDVRRKGTADEKPFPPVNMSILFAPYLVP